MKQPLHFIGISILALVVLSCTPSKNKTSVFWVNSVKVLADAGVAKRHCLQITKQDNLKNPQWETFYADIEGFKPKAGFFQKIEVLETELPEDKVPADTSSIKYTLVKVLEEKLDSKWRLNDIWALAAINGKKIKLSKGQRRPQLAFDLGKMKVSGTDGCNQLMGGLESVTANKIKFAPLATTLMMCEDMTLPDTFMKALKEAKTYEIKELELLFYDADKKELLRLKKID